jgi:hypothetical protein
VLKTQGGAPEPKPAAASKPPAGLDAKHRALHAKLADAVSRAKADPHSVSDEETDDMIAAVRKMPPKQAQVMSAAITGFPGKSRDDSAIRIRSAIASVKKNLDSQLA